uniref:Uncharacterized protein n=1 Tax=Tetraselmis chuii TaxID=63592 RepID=A0A7S1SLL5_9CHLO|mmetsp:Transcript_16847/g.30036  ORF Transcript_16847/g.30036 Transcript_16847/m.30036 type:complete len:122 (+) Transcript_16847:571-936(+)
MLALGVIHLQVERVAQTEPGALRGLLKPGKAGGQLFSSVVESATSAVVQVGKALESSRTLPSASHDEAAVDKLDEYTESELKAFDEKLQGSSSAESALGRENKEAGRMYIEKRRERERDDA